MVNEKKAKTIKTMKQGWKGNDLFDVKLIDGRVVTVHAPQADQALRVAMDTYGVTAVCVVFEGN